MMVACAGQVGMLTGSRTGQKEEEKMQAEPLASVTHRDISVNGHYHGFDVYRAVRGLRSDAQPVSGVWQVGQD